MRLRSAFPSILFAALGLSGSIARAGPPFFTDDPVPVEYQRWEIYLANQYLKTADDATQTAPHMEFNYGPVKNLQLHILPQAILDRPADGPSAYGFGDMELGAKFRFVQETDRCPQMAIYPLIEIPTGDQRRGLGNGQPQYFFPLWMQKSWGPWTSYGGGGYWLNPGAGHSDGSFLGWLLQRDLSKVLTLGAEVFHREGESIDGTTGTGFTVGGQANWGEHVHFLFSIGRDFSGPVLLTHYLAIQWTF